MKFVRSLCVFFGPVASSPGFSSFSLVANLLIILGRSLEKHEIL
jgi:hypothetical protein